MYKKSKSEMTFHVPGTFPLPDYLYQDTKELSGNGNMVFLLPISLLFPDTLCSRDGTGHRFYLS